MRWKIIIDIFFVVHYVTYCEGSDIPTVIIHNIAHDIFDYEHYCKNQF